MKVWKTEEYWMYFPFFKLHSWGKRSAVRRRRFIQRLLYDGLKRSSAGGEASFSQFTRESISDFPQNYKT
jgi:hypothetical protein